MTIMTNDSKKKKLLLWMGVMLVLVLTGCKKDSDDPEGTPIDNPIDNPATNPNNPDGVPNGTYFPTMGYVFDGLFYYIDVNSGTATFCLQTNEAIESITIPQQIELDGKNYTVTKINNYSLSGLKQLTSVKLPSTITDIGNEAFTGCEKLATINLPDGLTEIRSGTFQYCKALTSVDLFPGLTVINNYAFNGCESLTSVTLPATLTSIGQEAFHDCKSLKSVEIPEGVTSIGLDAFKDCKSLTSLSIPAGVQYYYHPFEGCDAIETLSVSCMFVGRFGTNITTLVLGEGVTNIEGNAFDGCTKLNSVQFSNTVKEVGPYAFRNCSSLTSIVLPESLIQIDDRAFYGCKNLMSVTCNAQTPPNFPDVSGYPAFDPETMENGTLFVPSMCVDAYKSAPVWSDFKNIVGI